MPPRPTLHLRAAGGRDLLAHLPPGWSEAVLGRAAEADVRLDHPEVSRRHARLRWRGLGLEVEDLGSRSGTSVNGRRVEGPVPLAPGDVLALGPVEARLLGPDPGPAAEVGPADAATLDPGADDRTRLERGRPGRLEAPAAGVRVALAGRSRLTLGRGEEADVRLQAPTVSRLHAQLERDDRGWRVLDLGSANGSHVNGLRVGAGRPFGPGDTLRVGPYRLALEDEHLVAAPPAAGLRFDLEGVGRSVHDRRTGAPLPILSDVTLAVEPGEFLGLLGASGSGKSTLLGALSGRHPPTEGQVRVDGHRLPQALPAYQQAFGTVPQELILHEALPVEEVLRYAARLRLPDDAGPDEVEAGIDRVLATVGLTLQRATRVRSLSGGQKKRVAVAMELLGRPQALFLDEATSGLDLGTEAQMMALFRELADQGTTVVCITHYVESLDRCDRVAWLVQGRLAFVGTPQALCAHVGAASLREVYALEGTRTAAQWVERFRASPAYGEQVVSRLRPPAPGADPVEPAPGPRAGRSPWREAGVLLGRMGALMRADARGLALALALGPLVGLLASLVLGARAGEGLPELARRQGQLAFVGTITAFFLGLFASVREVVKELPVFRHERFLGVRLAPYLASKALPLLGLGLLQVGGLLAALHLLADVRAPFLPHLGVLVATHAAAVLLGLALSAAVDGSDKAITLMLLVLLPQLLFANAFIALDGAGRLVGRLLVPCYWGHDAAKALLPEPLHAVAGPDGRPLLLGHGPAATGVAVLLAFAALHGVVALLLLARRAGPVAEGR